MTTPVFPTIGSVVGDDEQTSPDQVDSLCMQCQEQGVTRLLLTSIPFFGEVILMSFRCEHCGFSNNEIQSAGDIRPEGVIYSLRVLSRADLNRHLVRSPTCSIHFPDFELSLPAPASAASDGITSLTQEEAERRKTRGGQLTTIEGLVRDIIADLSSDQPVRKIMDPEGYAKIAALVTKLRAIVGEPELAEEGEETTTGTQQDEEVAFVPFSLTLNDPSGNSFLEFLGGGTGSQDAQWSLKTYERTPEQDAELGLAASAKSQEESEQPTAPDIVEGAPVPDDEVLIFPGPCSSCGRPIETRMKKVVIPYFKDIYIMSTNCPSCGYRDNEVKSGSAISDRGKRISLSVGFDGDGTEDLGRDVLKSETAGLEIPELDLVLQHGTLGGRFTTLEGLLEQVYAELRDKFVWIGGDAVSSHDSGNDPNEIAKWSKFLKGLEEIKSASRPFTLVIDDPLANSYVQNLYAPDPDPAMKVEWYDRTWEQNEELGLNDIKVEGYEEDAKETTEQT